MKQINKGIHSVTIRISAITILLVLPLNIWGIFSVIKMQSYMFDSVRNHIYSVGQLMTAELDSRMNAADNYLLNTLYSVGDFLNTALKGKGDSAYYHAVYNLHYAFGEQPPHLHRRAGVDLS